MGLQDVHSFLRHLREEVSVTSRRRAPRIRRLCDHLGGEVWGGHRWGILGGRRGATGGKVGKSVCILKRASRRTWRSHARTSALGWRSARSRFSS